jgi:DNA-binding NtrC family response regulator
MADSQSKAKVLVVEDDPLIREITSSHFEDSDLSVVQAANAGEAMKLLEADGIDLVFSDVQMPGTNGITLARLIRALYPDMPIILASGVVNEREIVDQLGPGIMFISKPYDLDQVVPQIRFMTSAPMAPS